MVPASKPFPRSALIIMAACGLLLIGSMVVAAIAIPRMVARANAPHELAAISSI
jgi:hypothetical protein